LSQPFLYANVPRVRKSASANAVLGGLIADAPRAVIEILLKVSIVEQSGLGGELLIAIVNDTMCIYWNVQAQPHLF
jgi:hypothetical protein